MPAPTFSSLVATDWLAARLGRDDLVVLDVSWYLPTSGRDARAEFRAGHIPGARFFDLDLASDPRTTLPHMMPEAAAFAEYVSSLGVADDGPIVVYDGSGANLSAARVWWMFRAFGHDAVAILDGGMGKWRAEGRPVESGQRPVAPRVFHARLDRSWVWPLERVAQALADGAAQVVDLRPAGRFEGTLPEPREGIPSGHMAGAINLPYSELVRGDGTALSGEELRARLARAGLRLDRPVVATCGSGTSACALLFALHQLGADAGALYDGSWTEWATRGMPVRVGPTGA
ncbi:MAG TPA: 3-mercaptopyruvate sulfurtransferase [Gemmatimonadales bacterium]|nr:3-mercaptopyruvate sulfurtransferase [Gemmatimonadales bacterium]